jgi:RHS repeat-associated protein
VADHLGSTSITTNADGTLSSEIRYSAFGEARYAAGITPTDYRYTGQLEQRDIKLQWYRSRWYDAALGRFVQADTMIPSPGNAQSWDHFAYVKNNPLRYSDPSGHVAIEGTGGGGIPNEFLSEVKIIEEPSLATAFHADYCIRNKCVIKEVNTTMSKGLGEIPIAFQERIEDVPGGSIPVDPFTFTLFAISTFVDQFFPQFSLGFAYTDEPNVWISLRIEYTDYGYIIQDLTIENKSHTEITLSSVLIYTGDGDEYIAIPLQERSIKPGEELTVHINEEFQFSAVYSVNVSITRIDIPKAYFTKTFDITYQERSWR